ncbi:MAG TPA: asparagine synthase (glutamine-hydrolyzing) [Nitrospiraceae bacterium]|jgi:asparagine synthase (glutamine-hydrolysing)|nr:asparagine synthase (glutamine-hydrolyzing) [Nitrospiraceae bacterium]
MCGIAGIYNLSERPIEPFAITKLCDAQFHRGPDDVGYVLLYPVGRSRGPRWCELTNADRFRSLPDPHANWLGSGSDQAGPPRRLPAFRLALGHRRLAILDPSIAGHQPMANETRTVWITYNGEIYNYVELKKELVGLGYRFLSGTDTEVILHLYEAFGPACVERLNGMFAFAIWDDRAETLWLVRDRFGIKPIYYTEVDGTFAFASEVKALLALEAVRREVNVPALVDYFTFQNTFGEETLFKGIRLLEPGQTLTVRRGGVERRRYWDICFEPDNSLREGQCIERLRFLLEDTIRRQLISDVPVGAYLSGGMDSGSITALAASSITRLMTFTGGFDLTNVSGFEAGFDERKDAEALSALFGTEHYQMVFHAGDLEWALPRVIWAIEDLRVGMCYPYYYTARLASRFVKVVLAGTGGDEIFAGYPWRYKVVEGTRDQVVFLGRYYRYWNRLIPADRRAAFFSAETLAAAQPHDPYDSFASILKGRADDWGEPLRLALYFEAKTFLHGLLVIEDKLSMAHSMESRVPLLDHALVDFVTRLPTRFLVNYEWDKNPGRDENLAGKYLFRRAMEGLLPDHILLKRKQGFSAPDQSWYQGPLMNYIKGVLLDRRTLARGYFREQAIRQVLEEHLSGRVNHRLLIWSLLSFEFWNRLFLDGDSFLVG